MTKIIWTTFAAAILVLAGCATYQPVPPGYTGPTAYLADTAEAEGSTRARLFYVESIDGNTIDNSYSATRRASENRGFSVYPSGVMRNIPIRPMRLKIVGTHITGAPIHEIASRIAGTFFSVEGIVELTPKETGYYTVKGELAKDASRVWIEDSVTHQIVTEIISSKP